MVQGRKTGRKPHRKDAGDSHVKEQGEILHGRLVRGVHLLPTLRKDAKGSANEALWIYGERHTRNGYDGSNLRGTLEGLRMRETRNGSCGFLRHARSF